MNFKISLMSLFKYQFPSVEDMDIDSIMFVIYTKEDIFNLCFYMGEDEDIVYFVRTDENGAERANFVPKDNITRVELLYANDIDLTQTEKKNRYV